MKLLTIGYIVKPQGIGGELKVSKSNPDSRNFDGLKTVYVGGKPHVVRSAVERQGFVYVRLEGVNDRDAAELLRGLEFAIERDSAQELPKGNYYIADLIGASVLADGKILGVVEDIVNYGASDVYQIKGEPSFMFALVDGLILSVDTELGRITVDAQRLEEVVVYED